jgi:hypothetical protein
MKFRVSKEDELEIKKFGITVSNRIVDWCNDKTNQKDSKRKSKDKFYLSFSLHKKKFHVQVHISNDKELFEPSKLFKRKKLEKLRKYLKIDFN